MLVLPHRGREVSVQGAQDFALRFSGFELSPALRRLSGPLGDIPLRAKSFDVLVYLANAQGRIVSKTELLDAIWPDVTVSDESLERCVSDVRAALLDDERKILKTVARRGYVFTANFEAASAPFPERKLHWLVPSVLIIFSIVSISVMRTWVWSKPEPAPVLAILPIKNASGDDKQNYFSEGLTEDITTALGQYKSLSVVASGSAQRFKNSNESADIIGSKLGATFLLSGQLRQSPEKIVLALQLVKAETGVQIWAGQYDGEADGFVGAKSNLVGIVASTLDAHMTKVELDRVALKPSGSLTAYDLVLKGNALLRNTHVEKRGAAIAEARGLYEAALAHDARSADAAVGIANSYLLAWLEPSPGHPTNTEFQSANSLQYAGDYARHAVELDETSASARATLGWTLFWQKGPAEALPSFDRALELNPGLADWRYGLLLSHGGRAKEAEAYMKRIMLIDPLYPPRYKYLLGKAFFFQGRYAEALPLINQAAAEMPSHRPSHVLLAATHAELGMVDSLALDVADIRKLDPNFTIQGWLKYIRISDPDYVKRLTIGLEHAGLNH
jgi:TolB-like protein/DNA-binding winged helix-turn-helix (wHTH) protein/Tfp pilus assembly protein PilF